MNYLQKSKRQQRQRRIIHTVFVLLLLLVLFFAGSYIRGVVQFVGKPLVTVRDGISRPFVTFFSYFASKADLSEHNYTLEQENKRLKIEALTMQSLREENMMLKQIASYVENTTQHITTRVLQRAPYTPYDTIVIDRGDDVITVGDAVLYADIPIGTVTEVYRQTAIATLYSSPNQKMFVSIQTTTPIESVAVVDVIDATTTDTIRDTTEPSVSLLKQTERIDVEAVGAGNGSFRIQIPKDVDIQTGATVTTVSGQLLGLVQGVEVESSNTFQYVYFRFPFDLSDLSFVVVSLGERE